MWKIVRSKASSKINLKKCRKTRRNIVLQCEANDEIALPNQGATRKRDEISQ